MCSLSKLIIIVLQHLASAHRQVHRSGINQPDALAPEVKVLKFLNMMFLIRIAIVFGLTGLSCANPRPLLTKGRGAVDGMSWFRNYNSQSWVPVQQAPIFGIACINSTCEYRRLVTVRMGSNPIVLYRNKRRSANGKPDRWRVSCPKNMLAMGLSSHNGNNGLTILCGPVTSGFMIEFRQNVVIPPRKSLESVGCPDGSYVQGIECFGYGCKYPGLFCVQLRATRFSKRKDPLTIRDNRMHLTDLFSSDADGLSPPMIGPIYSLRCFGPNLCERKQLRGTVRGLDPMFSSKIKWAGGASAEGSSVSCPKGTVIRQIRCKEKYCARVEVGCSSFINPVIGIEPNDVRISNPFSTLSYHDDTGTCPDGYFANRIECQMSQCSVMILGCVKVTVINWATRVFICCFVNPWENIQF